MEVDVTALLFGSKLKIAGTVLGGLVLTLGGAFVTGFVGVPSVERVDNQFGAVNESTTEIDTQLKIHNPNPIGVRLGGLQVNYTASMNGIQMASGEKKGLGIGTGNSTVNLTTGLQNDRIPKWWVTHIDNGEHTELTVDATVTSSLVGQSAQFQPANKEIDTDILGQFNSSEDQPVNSGVALVEDPILVIEQRNASWGETTSAETPIDLRFDIYNPKTQPVAISSIGYNITMNDIKVGEGETEETVTIPGETTQEVGFPTVIHTATLDDWWVSHLQHNQQTELTIDFYAKVQPPGTDQTVTVPLDDMTYTKTIETDFFGNKAASGSSDSSDSQSGDDTTTTTTESSDDENTTTTTTTEDDDDLVNRRPVAP